MNSFHKSLFYAAGEGAGVASLASDASNAFANSYLNVDIPLDGIGLISIPAAEIISPVFTLWITLVMMYLGALQYKTRFSSSIVSS